jgi:transposase
MEDRELYEQVLCLNSPWTVSQVELKTDVEEVQIQVTHPRGTKFCCPECDRHLSCYDHAEERRWRHLDSCQFQTILMARAPRVKCPEHGVKTVPVPWAAGSSRFTLLFERFAIDVLLATQTVTGAASLLRTSWDETWHILERAVQRGQDRKQPHAMPLIGIDEKAFAKRHKYATLIYDLHRSTVEAISDGNDTEAGIACFSQLSSEQIAGVEAVAMDMSAAYVKAAKETIPDAAAKIVHDRFHVMQLATRAVDRVRRGEHRELKADGDNRLAKTRYLWLTNEENLSEEQTNRLAAVFHSTLNTGKAWGYKELLRDLWNQPTAAAATVYFKAWYRRVIHTKLAPMKTLARTIKQRLENVVSFCTHHITNSVAEGMNSKIMSLKRRVGGYRNRENFKTAIYFYCGGLDLYPR